MFNSVGSVKIVSSVWPVLHYTDTEAALHFLTDVLGFDASLVLRDDDGDIVHAELARAGSGALNFGGTRHDTGVHAAMRPGTGAVYLVAADEHEVDALVGRVRRADARLIAQEPTSTAFGNGAIQTYSAAITDPEGNLWTIGTYGGATAD